MTNFSSMRLYSLGVVANDKKPTTNEIEVAPIEDMALLSGEVTDNVTEVSASGTNGQGVNYLSKINVTSTIKAEWLPMSNSNRMTSPDVRRGEIVMLYRLADGERFFWVTFENNSNTRKLETVVHAYSGTKNEDEPMNEQNSYTQGVSTHKGFVNIITTSKANGEPYLYNISVDAKNGVVTIKDDVGNFILLNSGESKIKLQNAAGSFLDMTKHTGTWVCQESINIKTQNWNLETTNMKNKGELLQEGNQVHKGNLNIQGGLSADAGAGNDGSAIFNGKIEAKVDVVSNGISLVKHHHKADVNVYEPI